MGQNAKPDEIESNTFQNYKFQSNMVKSSNESEVRNTEKRSFMTQQYGQERTLSEESDRDSL